MAKSPLSETGVPTAGRGAAFRLAGALALVIVASGCTTASTPEALDLAPSAATVQTGPAGYPDFSRPLTSAMAQMSDEEARQMQAEMGALGAGRQNGTISEAEYWRRVRELEALAKTHGTQAVTAIEQGQ